MNFFCFYSCMIISCIKIILKCLEVAPDFIFVQNLGLPWWRLVWTCIKLHQSSIMFIKLHQTLWHLNKSDKATFLVGEGKIISFHLLMNASETHLVLFTSTQNSHSKFFYILDEPYAECACKLFSWTEFPLKISWNFLSS